MIRNGATLRHGPAVAAFVAAALALQACDAVRGLVGIRETRISESVWSNVAIQAGGRGFLLQTADGKPLDGQLAVVVMGWAYPAAAGQLVLPEVALRQIKERSEGWFLVVAPGYLPRRVWMGQPDDKVVLQPVTPVVRYAVPPRGGAVTTPEKDLTVVVPKGLVKTPTNAPAEVGLSTYTPEITPADDQAMAAARSDFMTKLRARTGAGYRLAQACDNPEAPFPCPPIQHGLGLLIAVNGPIQAPATLEVAYDLDVLLRGWDGVVAEPWVADPGHWTGSQIARAKAAARILRTFRQIDALAPASAPGIVRSMLGDPADPDFFPPGVRLAGRQLVLPVAITPEVSGDSYFQTRNLTAILLGVKLEVTIVNPAVAPLPGVLAPNLVAVPPSQIIANTGGNLIGHNGAGIISDLGGGVVSTGGGGVVSTGGGGIIGNNGGALVGRVDSPLATGFSPKYRLQAYTQAPQAGLLGVDVADANDAALTPQTPTDAAAAYRLTGLPDTARFVFPRFRAGPVTLRGVAPAPGSGTVTCDLNAATTAVTCWILDELRRGRATLGQIKPAGYTADVAQFAPLLSTLSQAEAEQVAGGDVPTVAELVRTKYGTLGYAPQALARVSTLAGSGTQGWADGVGSAAAFDNPTMGALDLAGRLIVCDGDGTIRRIDPATAAVTTIAGLPLANGQVDGPQATATFWQPWAAVVAPTGNILIADHRNGAIRRIDMAAGPASPAYVTTFAGSGPGLPADGTGTAAKFSWVAGIARSPVSGDYFVVDNGNNSIRRVTPMGVVTTFAGSAAGLAGYLDGTGTAARFNQPTSLCFDGAGNMIVADRDNHVIRHITPAGVVTTLAGSGSAGYFDGAGLVSQFNEPRGVQVDADGGVLVVDSLNHRLRRIKPDQSVVTVAGSGVAGYADGDPLAAAFDSPRGVVLAPDGTIYITDFTNQRIRMIR